MYSGVREQIIKKLSNSCYARSVFWPLKLFCDASPNGLGACLVHVMPSGEERPVAYALYDGGMPSFSPKILHRGWWSVTRVKSPL